MKNTKSKEFLSEVNILCKVHHSNLIQLIGYAAGGDSLFLIYEFAENGALSDHLHRPTARGQYLLTFLWFTHAKSNFSNFLFGSSHHSIPGCMFDLSKIVIQLYV
ncbi:hypothetical protein SLEP1_g1680 [Rubroshorea leprosula]|uniref:Protein kinase domain-containing protein n=1 Tax=Rubroshorea leprosula TaxID=152421 RepID=A0AAV5HNA8_9ROSI|nr:hypothetical protein SLEP1_g1680 [Rubroshorea leprosula]